MKPSDLLLAPIPKRVRLLGGSVTLPAQGCILIIGDSPDSLMFAASKLKSRLGDAWQITASPAAYSTRKPIVLDLDPAAARGPEGYALDIKKDEITLSAAGAAGIYYGVCTLLQLMDRHAQRLPLVSIVDWPDFADRGVMLDVSRDKVPTMQTMKELVDMLSEWKLNRLQLYTEHTFAYIGHEVVWKNASPFTGEDMLELDAYCAQRSMELVPNQNSFGHMGRWLQHKQYEHLSEMPNGMILPDGTKRKGTSGCLNPLHPGSIALMEDLYDQLLPHFRSGSFNVGCDETWEIGKGMSYEKAQQVGEGRVYLDFLLQLHDLVRGHGRRMQFWGDIILKHPELIPELPKDIVAMEWGYEALHDFIGKGRQFSDSGLEFHVCPGTSSWNSMIGRTDNAIGNLRNAGVDGLAAGATGYLNTDWGDGGHLQYLPVSYLGFLYGACASWNAGSLDSLQVADALSAFAFQDKAGVMGRAVYDMGNAYLQIDKKTANATLWGRMLSRGAPCPELFEGVSPEELDRAVGVAWECVDRMKTSQMDRPDAKLILDEFVNAAACTEAACRIAKLGMEAKARSSEKTAVAKLLTTCISEHERLWLARNRPGGLADSLRHLQNLLKAVQG